jgi:hypothetical protein
MSCLDVPIQTILGTECIGDSLPKINTNFSVLGNAACDLITKVNQLSSVPAVDASVNVFDSPTIDLNWNASTRTLSADASTSVRTIGYDQTWVGFAEYGVSDPAPTRFMNVTYYNTTGRPIQISITVHTTSSQYTKVYINGVYTSSSTFSTPAAVHVPHQEIVPNGASYRIESIAPVLMRWTELR